MNIKLKKYGGSAIRPHQFIEMTIESSQGIIVEDVTNLSGHISADLIADLRNIADELEEQNRLVSEQASKKH